MASFKFVALIFALLIGSFVVQAREGCGIHEHFSRCGKPHHCQPSCLHPGGRVCGELCTRVCVCNGFRVRNHLNECVEPDHCGGRRGRF